MTIGIPAHERYLEREREQSRQLAAQVHAAAAKGDKMAELVIEGANTGCELLELITDFWEFHGGAEGIPCNFLLSVWLQRRKIEYEEVPLKPGVATPTFSLSTSVEQLMSARSVIQRLRAAGRGLIECGLVVSFLDTRNGMMVEHYRPWTLELDGFVESARYPVFPDPD